MAYPATTNEIIDRRDLSTSVDSLSSNSVAVSSNLASSNPVSTNPASSNLVSCNSVLSEIHPQNSSHLQNILSKLHDLSAPLSQEEVRSLLFEMAKHTEELAAFERYDDSSYLRNRIFLNKHIDLLLLCWKPSQRTPIHDHAGSTCGVYVVKGEAIEIGFNPSGVGLLIPTESKTLLPGDLTVSVDTEAHLVGNFASPACNLVTLHCYSPPLCGMRVFNQQDTFFANYPEITAQAANAGCYQVRR